VVDGPGIDQPLYRRDGDRECRPEDERALDARREVLGFGVPVGVPSSAGLAAQRNAKRATTAATRFTTDSAAFDNRTTEPVSDQARTFSVIVATAAPMDSRSRRKRRASVTRTEN
jgi:hypothetical protein